MIKDNTYQAPHEISESPRRHMRGGWDANIIASRYWRSRKRASSAPRTARRCIASEERGFALIMTVFVIALATILVMDMGYRSRFDQRASRAFSEGIQAEFVLKSGLNLAQVLLEMPKLEGINEDWLVEPWSMIASAPSLPISGFAGTPRIMIVDEEGKIDLNSIVGRSRSGSSLTGSTSSSTQSGSKPDIFWKNAARELFELKGFVRESYDEELHRTLGDLAYGAGDQVAVIHDWVDEDKSSYSSASFDGEGAESSLSKSFFYNRRLQSMSELLLVPGMTSDRLARIAPHVRVNPRTSTRAQRINVNTAPREVLLALGFSDAQVQEMMSQRLNLPITKAILDQLTSQDPELTRYTKVTSNTFGVYARVAMANTTRWMRAEISVSGRTRRRTRVRSLEFH